MKKILQNAFLRALCALVFGVLLLAFSGEMSRWMIYASGGMFSILGAAAMVSFLKMEKEHRPSALFPIVSVGCILFGVVQILFPYLFFGILRYLLAAIMLLLSIAQVYSLMVIHRGGVKISWLTYLLPLVGIGIAAFVTFYRGFAENDPGVLLILGVGFVVYALLEFWTVILVRRTKNTAAENELLIEESTDQAEE